MLIPSLCIIFICTSSKVYCQIDSSELDSYIIKADTLFDYVNGLDSIFSLDYDTLAVDSIDLRILGKIPYTNNNTTYSKVFNHPMETGIILGSISKEVNDGLFGIHIGSLFSPGAIPYYEESSDDAIQWLIELAPKSLRFPAGGTTKFMHLRPYRNIDGVPGLDHIKGYGYDIEEIIRFYDVTDNKIDIVTAADISSVLSDLTADYICDNCVLWMNADNFKEDFQGFYRKWSNQEEIPAGEPSAIEQFVSLVNDIQTLNPGLTVDIILCLNIFSETATRCKNIVTFLENQSENAVANLNVVGVEIGNENYYKSSTDMLGMKSFIDYWTYINGGESDSEWWDEYANHVFSSGMKIDHNYIDAFKLDPTVSCKIGIPARNIDALGYALRESSELEGLEDPEDDWNAQLRSYYNAKAEPGGPFAFDAIIIHPYYAAKDNYQDIAMMYNDFYSCPIFDYSSYDTNLQPAFDGILGKSDIPLYGNFRDFIKTRFLESYDYHNSILNFNLNSANRKELWTTEWNILDEYTPIPTETNVMERMNIFNNSFVSAFILQEWWLQNVKINYEGEYRSNFFTYAHFHNYHGTEYQNTLLLDADCADRKRHGLIPDVSESQRVYLRRTNYYVMKHLSPISRQDLKYIRNNQYISWNNPNLQVSTFITRLHDTIYVYYSNILSVEQHQILNGENLQALYPDHPIYGAPIGVQFGEATINCIDALQPYSTSGLSTKYDLNYCYDCHGTPDLWHPFEIRAENPDAIRTFTNIPSCYTMPNINETCISLPAYSVGYYKVPVSAVYATPKTSTHNENSELSLYPNPATEQIKYISHYSSQFELITISDMTGKVISQTTPDFSQTIDISYLPSGLYLFTISGKSISFSESFIKL